MNREEQEQHRRRKATRKRLLDVAQGTPQRLSTTERNSVALHPLATRLILLKLVRTGISDEARINVAKHSNARAEVLQELWRQLAPFNDTRNPEAQRLVEALVKNKHCPSLVLQEMAEHPIGVRYRKEIAAHPHCPVPLGVLIKLEAL